MTRVTDRQRRKRWARYSNEELARRKWALNPDECHPYAPRVITAKNTPGTAWMLNPRRNRDLAAKPCRTCGGSPQLPIHDAELSSGRIAAAL